ncbi:uncharacterized protein LOC109840177 [Asparagus officinalis]|uniref:uncharacterized protein LOC109840177 n=1 Tax=Asparagus officinalis TaxID=4686 RepID=UPI00098E2C64|nr:uncharacterized protein LOC109840177 [Asparagus officinalis]
MASKNAYTNKPSAKEIWNVLEEQYKDEEKLSKSHLIDKFLDFKFEDDTEVITPSKVSGWWLDTGATCHVCSNRDLFSSYVAAKENVSMVGRSVVLVLGTGTVVLTLSSGKTLALKDVKYVPSITKNLVSGSLLCDAGMRLDFQGGKVVLSFKKMYFGNAYRTNGMYKIGTTVPNSVVNEESSFAYCLVENL